MTPYGMHKIEKSIPAVLTPDKMTEEQKSARRVCCAALRLQVFFGEDPTIVIGPRHFDPTMHAQIDLIAGTCADQALSDPDWSDAEQGFIDNFGNFLTRKEAWQIAYPAGQVIRWVGGQNPDFSKAKTSWFYDTELYSENLY